MKRGFQGEDAMPTKKHGQIVKTPTEARQAEPGPSMLALLMVSTGLAIVILGIIWVVFFQN
ncbi:MAG: hypothetical protein WBA29_18975 [Xanthobacteraceae bacterium]